MPYRILYNISSRNYLIEERWPGFSQVWRGFSWPLYFQDTVETVPCLCHAGFVKPISQERKIFFTLQEVHGKTQEVGKDKVEGVDVLFMPPPRESFGGLDGLLEGFFYGFGAEAEFSQAVRLVRISAGWCG